MLNLLNNMQSYTSNLIPEQSIVIRELTGKSVSSIGQIGYSNFIDTTAKAIVQSSMKNLMNENGFWIQKPTYTVYFNKKKYQKIIKDIEADQTGYLFLYDNLQLIVRTCKNWTRSSDFYEIACDVKDGNDNI